MFSHAVRVPITATLRYVKMIAHHCDGDRVESVLAEIKQRLQTTGLIHRMCLDNFSHVVAGELAGLAYPRSPGALDELVRRGFRTLVALGLPPPLPVPTELNLVHCEVPDFSRVAPELVHTAVTAIHAGPSPVAVCCGGGIGRTGMVLASYLVSIGRTAYEAIAEVRAARPGSIDDAGLELSVHDYFEFLSDRVAPTGRPAGHRRAPGVRARHSSPEIAEEPRVFLMMRFRDDPEYRAIETAVRRTLEGYSLATLRADYELADELLWGNVRRHMQSCAYGIAVFETMAHGEVSPNVCLELGYMLASNRPCLLLKERGVRELQADLAGHLYKEFNAASIEESIGTAVAAWLRELGIAKSKHEKLLVFVSSGGTCRDPMAKVIFQQLLQERAPGAPIRVEAMALGDPSGPGASPGARSAIQEMYGADLLAGHRTARLTSAVKAEADLILVMERRMAVEKVPSGKVFVLKDYVGLDGDVPDPWPSSDDPGSRQRYRQCAADLRRAIDHGWTRLMTTLLGGGT